MGIEVDPDALRGLGQDIADLLGMLSQLQIHMIDCDRKFVGHSGLADSYDSFTERWAVGVAALMEDAGTMSEQPSPKSRPATTRPASTTAVCAPSPPTGCTATTSTGLCCGRANRGRHR